MGAEHQHGDILLGIAVLLPALRRPHFLKAGLHFLKDFGGVPHYQLHSPLSCFKEFHSFLMVFSFHALKNTKHKNEQ